MPRPDFPRTREFQRRFADEKACRGYLAASRWPEGYQCPRCGGAEALELTTRRLWRCKRCRRVGHQHLQAYLDEFTFRFNRRRTPMTAFQTLLGLGTQRAPTTYGQLYDVESTG